MAFAGWLFYITPQHYQCGTGEAPVNPAFDSPPSGVDENPTKVEVRKTGFARRARLERPRTPLWPARWGLALTQPV